LAHTVGFSAGKADFSSKKTPFHAVYTVKKGSQGSLPSRDVTTKLSLGGNNDVITELFLPRGSLVSDIPAGDGKLVNLFLRCTYILIGFGLRTAVRAEKG
jgi:hypothetical protein